MVRRLVKISHQLKVSTMDVLQLLFLLLVSCVAASAYPPQQPPPCRVVQMDAFCSDLSLRSAPLNLPDVVQMLDLSRNQVQNLTRETLAHHTNLRHLNLHSNKIHFIEPRLFEGMNDLKILDLSKNHLNVFAHSKTNIGPLKAVESLDLSSNGLYTGMSDYFLSDSPRLVNLSLNSNSITEVAKDTFSGSLSLRKISLHNNIILKIEDGAFDILSHLTELDLSKNSIRCIDDFNLDKLKVFNLSQNSLESFQSAQSDTPYELVTFDLSQNKMLFFPHLPKNNCLKYLDLSKNQIQNIKFMGNITFNCLRYLDMSYNQLKKMPEEYFSMMGSLEVLNSLTFGENTVQSLEELFLQGNDLTTLDYQIFQRLPNIKYLHLQQNNLQVCDSEPTDQNHKDPQSCVSFLSVPKLEALYLSENNLRSLPANTFANTPLKVLDLSLNPGLDMHKDSLSGLEHSLVHLSMRKNNISILKADLSLLRSLKYVDLSTNQLTTLPTWSKESSIESLNLQNNHLVTLEYSTILALKRSLKTLYMGSNPLSCCGNLRFITMVQQSAVVIPDIETVTCVHEDYSEPVSIKKVTQTMCHGPPVQNYIITVIVLLLLVMIVFVLWVKCCHSRRRKHNRGFRA
uniref:Leucine rich repeat containing 32 n=1 Tax=Oreochromis niloticus TaxID=8128 RepID=A0A669D473_ORENI